MNTLLIEGIKLYAYHGCFEAERKVGAYYKVDVSIDTPLQKASESDDLSDALDYTEVYAIVRQEMGISSKLIEHVGGRILKHLKLKFSTAHFEIKIMKLNPPVHGEVENVSVILKG